MPPLQENNNITLWKVGVAVTVLLVIALSVFALILKSSGSPIQDPGTTTITPVGGGNNSTSVSITPGSNTNSSTQTPTIATVTAQDGSTIGVRDFKNSTTVEADQNNPGLYYLAGGTSPTPATTLYSTFYVDADQSFNITLLQEPIGEVRVTAEQELAQILGIGQVDMCRLRYWVGVPDSVNTIFSGKNLGFSFCPGSTPL